MVPALKNAYGDSMGENRERLRKIIERAENYQRKTVTPEDVLPADMGLYAVRHVRDIQLAQAGLDRRKTPPPNLVEGPGPVQPQYREHPYYTRDLDDTAGSIAWVRGEIGAPMEGNTPAGKKPNEYPYFDLHGNMAMAGSPGSTGNGSPRPAHSWVRACAADCPGRRGKASGKRLIRDERIK